MSDVENFPYVVASVDPETHECFDEDNNLLDVIITRSEEIPGGMRHFLSDGQTIEVENESEEHTQGWYPPQGDGADHPVENTFPPPQGAGSESRYQPSATSAAHTGTPKARSQSATPMPDESRKTPRGERPPLPPLRTDEVAASREVANDTIHVTPASMGYAEELSTNIWVSLGFKLYFGLLLYGALVVIFVNGYNWLFANLYRLYSPPLLDVASFWQSSSHLCLILTSSFFYVTELCLVWDMLREFWRQTKCDNLMWGFTMSKSNPPWILYLVVIIAVTILPVCWSAIYAGATNRGFLFFIQYFFFITQVIVLFIIQLAYIGYFIKSLLRKRAAYENRLLDPLTPRKKNKDDEEKEESESSEPSDMDEEELERWRRRRERARKKKEKKRRDSITVTVNQTGHEIIAAKHRKYWYDSTAVRFEFGLDKASLRWSLVMILLGITPLIIISIVIAVSGVSFAPPIGWIFVAVLALLITLALRELSKKPARSIGVLIIVGVMLIYAIISLALSGRPALFGVFVVQLIATQCFFLRKREYRYRYHEIAAIIGVSGDEVVRDPEDGEPFDSYLCFCRNTILHLFTPCCDTEKHFGVIHPKVREKEKKLNKERASLYTDQKFLMYWWVGMWIILVALIGYGQAFQTLWSRQLSERQNDPINGTALGGALAYRFSPLCTTQFTTFPIVSQNYTLGFGTPAPTFAPRADQQGQPLKDVKTDHVYYSFYDLALLTSIGYQDYRRINAELDTWFRNRFPKLLADYTNKGIDVPEEDKVHWIDHWENQTGGLHVIALRSTTRGPSLYRSLDWWGDSLAFQIEEALVPTMGFWPMTEKQAWVAGTHWLRRVYGSADTLLDPVIDHVNNLTKHGKHVVITGYGFEGGLATVIGARTNQPSVSFGGPGVGLSEQRWGIDEVDNSGQAFTVNLKRSIYSHIDRASDKVTHFNLDCDADQQQQGCSSLDAIANAILQMCGDPYGRTITA